MVHFQGMVTTVGSAHEMLLFSDGWLISPSILDGGFKHVWFPQWLGWSVLILSRSWNPTAAIRWPAGQEAVSHWICIPSIILAWLGFIQFGTRLVMNVPDSLVELFALRHWYPRSVMQGWYPICSLSVDCIHSGAWSTGELLSSVVVCGSATMNESAWRLKKHFLVLKNRTWINLW